MIFFLYSQRKKDIRPPGAGFYIKQEKLEAIQSAQRRDHPSCESFLNAPNIWTQDFVPWESSLIRQDAHPARSRNVSQSTGKKEKHIKSFHTLSNK